MSVQDTVDSGPDQPTVPLTGGGAALWDPDLVAGHAERGVVLEGCSPFKTTNLDDGDLVRIARQHERTPGQVVLRWHVQHGVVAIPEPTDPGRSEANLDVFGFTLDEEEMATLDGFGRR